MSSVGRGLLVLTLMVIAYGIAMSVVGHLTRREDVLASSRRATYVVFSLATAAMLLIEIAYLRDDFSMALVAGNSSTTTPLFYKVTAVWSSQAGSLLLWLVILTGLSALAIRMAQQRYASLVPLANAVLLVVAAFFTLLLVFASSPFEAAPRGVVEGNGLQPLLRYPMMALHPVALYTGYAGFAVPFAFATSALVSRRLDASWLVAVRRFTLLAWTALAVGLVLGSRWSYAELGWGGYWGWDPVENAALLPFLTSTALLHSSMIQEKRGMLKVWNVSLVMVTFLLALTGTFLVRSGILDSIHAFGASTLGVPFVVFIGMVTIASLGLVLSRLRDLRSEHRLESLLSREAIFLLNNLVLVSLAIVIFWGTFWPLIAEAFTGERGALGPPWFERFVTPLGIVLVLLTGVGPLTTWRRVTRTNLRRAFVIPMVMTLTLTVPAVLLTDLPGEPPALVAVIFVTFTLSALAQEFVRGTRVRVRVSDESVAVALLQLIRRNRRRYGGYLTHVGFAVLLLGVAASSSFETSRDISLKPGQDTSLAGYDINYRRPTVKLSSEKITLGARVDVSKDGRPVAALRPARELFPSQDLAGLGPVGRFLDGEATSEIGLRQSLGRDIWVAMQPDVKSLAPLVLEANRRFADAPGRIQGAVVAAIARQYARQTNPAQFRIIVRTGVTWIWIGSAILAVGALVALWPTRRPRGRTASETTTPGQSHA